MINLIDAMHFVRRAFEGDVTGRAPRRIITDMLSPRDGHIHIWCWDAPGSRARRQALYPAYKAKRLPHPDNIWPMIDLLKKALVHTPVIQITAATYEADDVIGTMCRAYSGQKKHIWSSDRDLGQLLDANTTADFIPKVPPDLIRLFKTCVGDPSDNIAGIPGFGGGAWDATDKKYLASMVHYEHPVGVGPSGMPTRCVNWVNENPLVLRALWEITGLYTIPMSVIEKGMITGTRNEAAADAILKEFRH